MQILLFMLFLFVSLGEAASLDEQLFDAAKKGDVRQIRALVSKGAQINTRSQYDLTPLMWATNWNKLAAVKALLALGADPNLHRKGESALYIATGRDTEIVRALLQAGAEVNMATEKVQYTPLGSAASHRADTFQRLQRSGSYKGPFPNRIVTVKLLIQAGANVNHVDSFSESPLRIAIRVHNVEIARLLLEAGADVHQRIRTDQSATQRGDTILMEAVKWYALDRDTAAIALLLKHGANPNDRNETPYNEFWERKGGSDWSGYSVLTFAAKRGYYPVVKLLLAYGADPSLPRTDGKTALELARENKHPATTKSLKNYVYVKSLHP